MATFDKQENFPLLDKFKQHFDIKKNVVFAYDGVIYTNYPLSDDLVVHESTHHRQQERDGLDYWVENYLNNNEYRLKQEIEAYQTQLRSIKDRNYKHLMKMKCAKDLSSSLYGNIITYNDAIRILEK